MKLADHKVLLERAESHLLAGQDRSARRILRRILRDEPQNAPALHLLGIAQARRSDLADASSLLVTALQLRPHEAGWHRDLGIVQAAAEDWVVAARSFERSLQLKPADEHSLALRGEALLRCGLWKDALSLYQKAELAHPACGEFLIGMGKAYAALKQPADAIRVLLRSIELAPNNSQAHELLAGAYTKAGLYDHAVGHYSISADLQPGGHKALAALTYAQLAAGEVQSCVNTCRQAMKSGLTSAGLHACYLTALLHCENSPWNLRAEFEEWNRTFGNLAAAPAGWSNTADPHRQLRIGYMTEDLRSSPASHFILPMFQNHDPTEVCAYYYLTHGADEDAVQPCAGNVRDVRGKDASEIAAIVTRDRIDVLVDVGWHSHFLHLLVFSCRPAPVQCVIPSFPGTTGSPAVDYLLSDEWVCPAGAEAGYREKVVRIPSGWLPYSPPVVAPPVSPLPCIKTGKLTFGLFQRPAKLGPQVWDAVAEILHHCENSVLLLNQASRDLDLPASRARGRCMEALESRGIPQDRLIFRGSLPLDKHLELLAQADIALDTFPYNGVTTTYECLWMGVPVITLTGDNPAGRMGFAILQKIGLNALAASTPEQFVSLALSLAGDHRRLDGLRHELRDRMRLSDLAQPLKTTRGIEKTYRHLWSNWCSTQNSKEKGPANNS